jgi:hypothetical protein
MSQYTPSLKECDTDSYLFKQYRRSTSGTTIRKSLLPHLLLLDLLKLVPGLLEMFEVLILDPDDVVPCLAVFDLMPKLRLKPQPSPVSVAAAHRVVSPPWNST